MDTADVLLVLDDGAVVPCHSHILSMHSAVLCNALKDSACQHDEKVRLRLADFTETQCSALLGYLYRHDPACVGARTVCPMNARHVAFLRELDLMFNCGSTATACSAKARPLRSTMQQPLTQQPLWRALLARTTCRMPCGMLRPTWQPSWMRSITAKDGS